MQQYQNPMYQNPYMNRTTPYYAPTNNGIIWVQGIEGAKAYQLVPNSNVQLMDSENDGVFYIKVSDNVGMCTLRTFKYTEVTNEPHTHDVDLSRYVTRDEVAEIVANTIRGIKDEQSLSAIKPITE